MSWQRIEFPGKLETDPNVVEIGKLAWAIFEKENKPDGFGMFHGRQGNGEGPDDKFFVYFTPVAAALCGEIAERFPFEACEAPAYDEPDIAYVFGDPRSMALLKGTLQAQSA